MTREPTDRRPGAIGRRLDYLLRKNRGRSLKSRLERILVEEVGLALEHGCFLDLEASDRLRETRRERFEGPHLNADSANEGLVRRSLEARIPLGEGPDLAPPVPGGTADVYVEFPKAEEIGLLSMPASAFRAGWTDLLELSPDGMVVFDRDFRNMVVLDLYEHFEIYDEGLEGEVLVLYVWGDDWVEVVAGMAMGSRPRPGSLQGMIRIADDFDAPLPELVARTFRGETE